MQRKLLLEDRRFGAIPLLQAVVVCLKVSATSSVNTSAIPKVKNFNPFILCSPLMFFFSSPPPSETRPDPSATLDVNTTSTPFWQPSWTPS